MNLISVASSHRLFFLLLLLHLCFVFSIIFLSPPYLSPSPSPSPRLGNFFPLHSLIFPLMCPSPIPSSTQQNCAFIRFVCALRLAGGCLFFVARMGSIRFAGDRIKWNAGFRRDVIRRKIKPLFSVKLIKTGFIGWRGSRQKLDSRCLGAGWKRDTDER